MKSWLLYISNRTDNRDNTMADSGIRHMVDAQLDQVSMPVDDNIHVDFTAMIQDIDQLDQILASMQYANHTDNRDNTMADSDVRRMTGLD